MAEDLVAESIYWAKEMLKVDSEDPDAHYVLAVEALDDRTPNVPEARRHLKVLEEKQAPPLRRLWVRAKLADTTGDSAARTLRLRRSSQDRARRRDRVRSTASRGFGS